MTEIAQLAGDFNSDSNYVASGLPKPLSMEEVDYVTDSIETRAVEEIANISDVNIKTEVMNCVSAIKNIGMDVLMIDVTHDKLKIPAFYTIVPGAHFRERSMINDVGLFSAKLVVELISDAQLLEAKLLQMEELLPDAYYLEFYRGRNYFNMGFPESALSHFESALQKNPEAEDLPYIYSFMGSCLKDLGKYEDAIRKLEIGLLEDEERPDLHNTLGVCYFKQENYNQ